jgi:hypothetical protein
MGLAQYQGEDMAVKVRPKSTVTSEQVHCTYCMFGVDWQLVGPDGLGIDDLIYPAQWDCKLSDTWCVDASSGNWMNFCDVTCDNTFYLKP